jgi:hypothetical protein
VSVRGKAGGAVVSVIAPEASAAASAAGVKAGDGTGAILGTRKRTGSAASHRTQIDAIKSRRAPEPEPEEDPAAPAAGPSRTRQAFTDQTGSPGWWPSNAEPMRAANTGGGFVLGVFLWVGVRAYLEGGTLGVRQLLAAKFLNKTGPTK